MFKYTIFSITLLLALSLPAYAGRTSAEGRNSRSNERWNRPYSGRSNYYPEPTQPPEPQTAKEYLDQKSGFSTFGIISIIFAIIMVCLLIYYGIICYPLLCREDKKYRFMDVSSTITAQSRSMSIENFPADSKLEK